jgi:hypothetical protein
MREKLRLPQSGSLAVKRAYLVLSPGCDQHCFTSFTKFQLQLPIVAMK